VKTTPPAAPRVEKTSPTPVRKASGITLDARAVAAALSDRTRFRMMEILSAGVALSPTHFEYILRGDRRALARHLEILRACGLVIQEKGADARVRLNRIRPEILKGKEDGHYIVDYGSGELRVPEAAANFEKPPTFAA
jgi:DNA-binding transcriptional ArsR family regulator